MQSVATDQEVVGAGGEYELVSSERAIGAAKAHVAQSLRLEISSHKKEYHLLFIHPHFNMFNRHICKKRRVHVWPLNWLSRALAMRAETFLDGFGNILTLTKCVKKTTNRDR